jgi:hypothetical protein
VVIAADHVGDAHVVVVDRDGEHIGGRSIGAQQYEIVDIRVGARDRALDIVGHGNVAVVGHAKPDNCWRACGERTCCVAPG